MARKSSLSNSSSVLFVLVCLTGAVVAQTFQYSRGWTNGKKRGGGGVPRVFQEPEGGPDALGVCQMLRLREILAQKKRDQVILPCEVLGEPEGEVLERFKRKVRGSEEPTSFNAPAAEAISQQESHAR